MEKLELLRKISEIYDTGGNIIQYLKEIAGTKLNDIEDILISYDFQAGSYIKYAEKEYKFVEAYTSKIANLFEQIGEIGSIMEVGVGEATTLANVLTNLNKKPGKIFGFDLSWSRIKYANSYMRSKNIDDYTLFTGDLFNIPVLDNSIDIVYTSHSLEPNGGKEIQALEELYRITKKYLVLLEPSYEFADEKGKARMIEHGYVKNLYETALSLKMKVVENRIFDIYSNPLNPTGLIIIQKEENKCNSEHILGCPITKTKLYRYDDLFYSPESLLAYPILSGIPCLLPVNAIVATKFLD